MLLQVGEPLQLDLVAPGLVLVVHKVPGHDGEDEDKDEGEYEDDGLRTILLTWPSCTARPSVARSAGCRGSAR